MMGYDGGEGGPAYGSVRAVCVVGRPGTTANPKRQRLAVGSTLWTGLTLLAQEGGAGPRGGSTMWIQILTLWLPIGFLFYFFLIRPQRQEQSRRQTMLDALKKNDRVVTSGGIYGVVTNVHREADEVTVKVDETTNTKLRLTLGSIARVLVDESSGDK